MTIKGKNQFAWGKEDVIDTLNDDIILTNVKVPMNNHEVVLYPFSYNTFKSSRTKYVSFIFG